MNDRHGGPAYFGFLRLGAVTSAPESMSASSSSLQSAVILPSRCPEFLWAAAFSAYTGLRHCMLHHSHERSCASVPDAMPCTQRFSIPQPDIVMSALHSQPPKRLTLCLVPAAQIINCAECQPDLLQVVYRAEAVSDGLLQLWAGRVLIAGLPGPSRRQLAPPEGVVPVSCEQFNSHLGLCIQTVLASMTCRECRQTA